VSPDSDAVRLSERLRQSTLAWFDVLTLYVGQKLGFYEALASAGPLAASDLATRTGTHPRYVREWLEQQAVGGLLAVDDPTADPEERRYRLPEGHARVLVDRDDPLWQGTRPHSLLPVAWRMPALLEAFRSGGGLSSADQDADARVAQASLGRVAYLASMGDWIASMPDVDGREVLQRMRAVNPAVRAILSSGFTVESDPSLSVPGTWLLQKPYTPDQVRTALSDALVGLK